VSGSSSLHFLSGDVDWDPKDIDLYAPNEITFEALCNYAELNDYEKGPVYDQYSHLGQVLTVQKFSKMDLSIDIIQLSCDSAMACIVGFWGTPVMTGATINGFFMAYPQLNKRKLGFIAHSGLIDDCALSGRTALAAWKYSQRCFTLRMKPMDFPDWPNCKGPNQKCNIYLCTHRKRWLGDNQTAVGIFNIDRTRLEPDTVTDTVQWVIGGEECYGVQCVKEFPMAPEALLNLIRVTPRLSAFACCEAFIEPITIVTTSLIHYIFD
jgi:hypothetical protein